MLDWLESPELRRRCHAGLNKSEQRHFLAQVIGTGKQGRIADRSAEAQQFRASALNLVIAAIVFWNSTYIADAIAHLRATDQSVPDAWLAHTSPLSWEHISFSGDFLRERPPRPQISAAPQSRPDASRCMVRDFLSPFGRSVQQSERRPSPLMGEGWGGVPVPQ